MGDLASDPVGPPAPEGSCLATEDLYAAIRGVTDAQERGTAGVQLAIARETLAVLKVDRRIEGVERWTALSLGLSGSLAFACVVALLGRALRPGGRSEE